MSNGVLSNAEQLDKIEKLVADFMHENESLVDCVDRIARRCRVIAQWDSTRLPTTISLCGLMINIKRASEMDVYACHCNGPGEDGLYDDTCLLDSDDSDDIWGCAKAVDLHNNGKTKFDCEFWRKIGK
jgi:hypothetical protein